MSHYDLVTWNDIDPADSPLCIIGAGFPLGVLTNPTPSTHEIIKKTVRDNGKEFPILSILSNSNISPNLSLNCVWQNIEHLSVSLSNFYNRIEEAYNSSAIIFFKNIFSVYKRSCVPPQKLLWVLLGLELKKMLSLQYDYQKIGSYKQTFCEKLRLFLKKPAKVTWISLNYDLVLEKILMDCCAPGQPFNIQTKDITYFFLPLLFGNDFSIASSKHIIIKPHGSLNVVFETMHKSKNDAYHKIYFADRNDFTVTLSQDEYGYTKDDFPFTEKRAWLIGYLPDAQKDELNSRALFSDLAHDLCKWNMTSTSFALIKATSIIVLGYRMPREDEWIWKRIQNLDNKDIRIYVASKKDSSIILNMFYDLGYRNLFLVNNGDICPDSGNSN